jgi:hypothetical protein
MGTSGGNNLSNDNVQLKEIAIKAAKQWKEHYIGMGIEESVAEEMSHEIVVRTLNLAKMNNILGMGGLPPTEVSMVGNPISWSWDTVICSSSTVPSGGPATWIWTTLIGTLIVPVGTVTSWSWQSVCCSGCETECQSGCLVDPCQTGCLLDPCQTCEVGCQDCEATCLTQYQCTSGCETQYLCNSGCETTPCQSACLLEYQCDSGCEIACEDCGQGIHCQPSSCVLDCKITCNIECQDYCLLNCQNLCETRCNVCGQLGEEMP